MCSEMESMSHRCWITLWYMKETILEPFPPLHKKNWDIPDQCVSKSTVGIIDQCCISLQRYYKIYYTVLYKLPRFYNAYGTGGSTMIFFHSRTLRVYPQGGGILEPSNLRVYIFTTPWIWWFVPPIHMVNLGMVYCLVVDLPLWKVWAWMEK